VAVRRSCARAAALDHARPRVGPQAPADGSSTTETRPRFSGTAGAAAGDAPTVDIAIRAGSATSGGALLTVQAPVAADGTFTVAPLTALEPGSYTARVSQSDDLGHHATSAAVTFTVLAPDTNPVQPTVHVCKSRRMTYKHVRRPKGSNLRVVATVNGEKIRSTIRRDDILVPVDLRGKPKGAYTVRVTYTVRVSVTKTLKHGQRKTVTTVERYVYRTCA
jgi:hypothetical protein